MSHIRSQHERLDPARSVVDKFRIGRVSGAHVLAPIIGRDKTTILKWMYPREARGTGGLIPSRYHVPILKAAHERGIPLNAAELSGFSEANQSAA
jgi:hypothetical protein